MACLAGCVFPCGAFFLGLSTVSYFFFVFVFETQNSTRRPGKKKKNANRSSVYRHLAPLAPPRSDAQQRNHRNRARVQDASRRGVSQRPPCRFEVVQVKPDAEATPAAGAAPAEEEEHRQQEAPPPSGAGGVSGVGVGAGGGRAAGASDVTVVLDVAHNPPAIVRFFDKVCVSMRASESVRVCLPVGAYVCAWCRSSFCCVDASLCFRCARFSCLSHWPVIFRGPDDLPFYFFLYFFCLFFLLFFFFAFLPGHERVAVVAPLCRGAYFLSDKEERSPPYPLPSFPSILIRNGMRSSLLCPP